MRPLIAITADYNDPRTQYASPYGYARSVERAGGLPLILPYLVDLSLIGQYVDLADGILFSGGDDLDPAAWNEPRHDKVSPVDPKREAFERALLTEVESRRKPILGVCLGSQLMNVHRGGSLYQFLPELNRESPLEHRKLDDWGRRHSVTLDPQSIVARAMRKTEVTVNTSHKQAVKTLGKNLRIVGKSPDGIVEGIEDPTMPLYVGVQWHPERMTDQNDHLALFKLLVDRAAATRK